MTMTTDLPVLDSAAYREFGRTGLKVSPLGFGGAPIGNLGTEQAAVSEILTLLLDHGVNLIDTAHAYHNSEELIGAAVGDRRDEYVLVTKCGSKWGEDDLPPAWTPEYIRATVDRSLQRLRTDRLDVLLLHSCELDVLQAGDVLAAAIEARDAGKVRFVGYSGDNEEATWAASNPDIAVIQTSISMCDQRNIDTLLPAAIEHNVGTMAKRPVANGAWKTRDAQHQKYLRYAERYHERFERMTMDLEMLREACNADLDWPEIALRFTLSTPGLHTAIVGTTNPSNVRTNLRAAAAGPLPKAAVTTIRDAWKSADPAGEWEGLT